MFHDIKKTLQELHTAYMLMRKADKLRLVQPDGADVKQTSARYLVFKNTSKSVGLMTYAAQIASFCEYADRNGYELIVDMKSNPCVNLDADRVGIDNAWEYYYEQPFPEAPTLEEVYTSSVYYLTPEYRKELLGFYPGIRRSVYYRYIYNKQPSFRTISIPGCYHNPEEYRYWCGIAQRYLRLNESTKAYVDNEYDSLMKGKRVLGVSLRGTDYAKKKTYAHPIQPSLEEVITKSRENMDLYGYEYIYFSCEEYASVQAMEEAFPGKIIINQRKFFDHIDFEKTEIAIGDVKFDRENDAYLRGLEYLSSIYLLSRCDALIAGQNTGSQMAYIFNNGNYEHVFFYEMGEYGIDDKE